MAFTTAVTLQLIGAALVVFLGLAVLAVRPRTETSMLFGLFALGFGGQFVVTNLGTGFEVVGAVWYYWGRLGLRFLAVVGAVMLALRMPPVAERRDAPLLAIAALVSLVPVSLTLAPFVLEAPLADLATRASFQLVISAVAFLLFALALRYRRADATERREATLVSTALLLYLGFAVGAGFDVLREASLLSGDPTVVAAYGAGLAILVLLHVVWLANAAHAGNDRAARNTALTALAMPLLGLVYLAYVPDFGMLGISRTLAVALLAYGIVQHQILGLDLKVRWGISKSTVAAAFITVFFLAGEGAQLLFGTSNEIVGLIAAGALVFALSPLQRFADRVAEHAVPVHAAPDDARVTHYRRQVELAWADGTLGTGERAMLRELREFLGLSLEEAERIEREGETAHAATPK